MDDGLFVDYSCEAGMDWLPIARKEGFVGQTQTCYADAHGVKLGGTKELRSKSMSKELRPGRMDPFQV